MTLLLYETSERSLKFDEMVEYLPSDLGLEETSMERVQLSCGLGAYNGDVSFEGQLIITMNITNFTHSFGFILDPLMSKPRSFTSSLFPRTIAWN